MATKKEKEDISKLKLKLKLCTNTNNGIRRYIETHVQDTINDLLIEEFQLRKQILVDNQKAFDQHLIDLLCLSPNEEEIIEVDEFKNVSCELLSKINVILNKAVAKPYQSNNVYMSQAQINSNYESILTAKLQPIQIEPFTGKNLNKFKPFIEIFKAVIEKNSNVSKVEKLFYLRSYLRDEALALIDVLPIIGDSYDNAQEILDKRYNNQTAHKFLYLFYFRLAKY